MDNRLPPDPISSLGEIASNTHEMFSSYVEAGFTEQQALYLTGQIISAMIEGNGV